MACSYGVILLQDLSCALADDNAGCHCVASRHAGHDGTVCDAKVVDSIDPEIAINDCHGVAATELLVREPSRRNDFLSDSSVNETG